MTLFYPFLVKRQAVASHFGGYRPKEPSRTTFVSKYPVVYETVEPVYKELHAAHIYHPWVEPCVWFFWGGCVWFLFSGKEVRAVVSLVR